MPRLAMVQSQVRRSVATIIEFMKTPGRKLPMVVSGPRRHGKTTIVQAAAHAHDRELVTLSSMDAMPEAPMPNVVLLIRDAEKWTSHDIGRLLHTCDELVLEVVDPTTSASIQGLLPHSTLVRVGY